MTIYVAEKSLIPDDFFQRFQVFAKQVRSPVRYVVGGAWLPSDKPLGYADDLLLFKRFQMAGEVSVGQVEQLLQCIKIKRVVHHECRHDSKPDAAIEYFQKV